MAIVLGEHIAAQAAQALRIAIHQGNGDPGTGGQHQLCPEAGIQQQIPALTATPLQIWAIAQQQHPGIARPGEGQGGPTLGGIQTAHRPRLRRQSGQQLRGADRPEGRAGQVGGPAIPQLQQGGPGPRRNHGSRIVQQPQLPRPRQPGGPGRGQIAAGGQQLGPLAAAARQQSQATERPQPQQLAPAQPPARRGRRPGQGRKRLGGSEAIGSGHRATVGAHSVPRLAASGRPRAAPSAAEDEGSGGTECRSGSAPGAWAAPLQAPASRTRQARSQASSRAAGERPASCQSRARPPAPTPSLTKPRS